MTFFQQPTEQIADFCKKHDVDYLLIHIPTITTSWKIPYSYCYVSNTRRLKKHTAAGELGIGKGNKNFYEIALPGEVKNVAGYRLYKFISNEDIKRSKELNTSAWEAYYLGNHKAAGKLIRQAYRSNPNAAENYQAYIKIRRKLPPPINLPPRRERPASGK
jgi:hypothetical protein